MTSGRPIGKKEDQFIRAHCKGMFASDLARQLVLRYPEENGGTRDKESIQRYMRKNGII
jgi:hypothetical protein